MTKPFSSSSRRHFFKATLCFIIPFLLLGSITSAQVISTVPPSVPKSCQVTHSRALQLVQEYDAKLSSGERGLAETVVERVLRGGGSRADGYNEFGAGEMLKANHGPAAWGALKAATLEWTPRYVSNVGVYLSYENRLEDAGLFLQCANTLAPQSPFVVEARALLAYRKRDYQNASSLIEQAARMMPGDMNVRYSAGVIFFRAGDKARAKQYLQDAQRMAPNYQSIIDALKVVDPAWRPTPSAQQDALGKAIAECFRFMDELLARGKVAGMYREEMRVAGGTAGERTPPGGNEYAKLQKAVEQHKAEITNRESKVRDPRAQAKSILWNAALYQCIAAYLETTSKYQEIINDQAVDIILARSMRMSAVILTQKMKLHNGSNSYRYVIQDEKFKYEQTEEPARRAFEAGLKTCEGRPDSHACMRPYEEAYCATTVPAWIGHRNSVFDNMQAAEAGYQNAAEDFNEGWNRLARRAADYSKRVLAVMKPVTAADLQGTPAAYRQIQIDASSPQAYARLTKDSYKVYIGMMGSLLVGGVALRQSNEILIEALDTAPAAFLHSAFYTDTCQQTPSKQLTLDAEMEKLFAALEAASKFEAGPPECEIEIGGFKTSFKPFSSDNNFNLEHSGVKVWGEPGTGRVGVEAEMGSVEAQLGPTTAEVSVKLWSEGTVSGGTTGNGVQVEAKAGVGFDKGGVEAACYVGSGSFKFDARAFTEALRN